MSYDAYWIIPVIVFFWFAVFMIKERLDDKRAKRFCSRPYKKVTRLLLALALLGLAGPVGAAIEYVDGNKSESCPSNARCETWYTVTKKQHGCLTRMEEAMKAMEPYFLMKEKDYRAWAAYQVNLFQGVLKQWNKAKRECWSKP